MDHLGNLVFPDQRIGVDEGISLSADVYTPKAPGRYPAVLSFTAYNTERLTAGIPSGSNEIGSPSVFTDRGYGRVIISRRGMGRSDGDTGMFLSDRDVDDYEKAIAWAAIQPWCNGDVVLFGTSYFGMTQLQVALRNPPALKAFFANEICTDYFRHLVQFGGVPALHFLNIWMGSNFTQEQFDSRMGSDQRALISQLLNGPLRPMVERMLPRRVDGMFEKFMSATPIEDVRKIYANWLFDGKSRDTTTIPLGPAGTLEQIKVPFVTVENLGYFNLHQFGSYELFEKACTPADNKWLILAQPTYDLPVFSWQGEALAFFDHLLYGTENGYSQQAAVRYWVEGAERFEEAATFPPARAKTIRLELESAGADTAVHRLVPGGAAEGSNSWAAVPIGLPVLGGLEDVANPTLAFELLVTEEMLLAGAVTAHLRFSCNEIDSYVVARLSRVDTAGERHHLSLGALRPAGRTVDLGAGSAVEIAVNSGDRRPLVPGRPVDLRFSLTPAPTLLLVGDRLRLDVASRTDLLRKGVGEGFAHFDLPVPPYLSRNTLHFGGGSWIEVDRN
ncbi:CocE/NonD family hydrolase [Subtercola lobariae]|nr:CocE/NonD family hydrolase [Subtercola lobariae]